MVVTYFEYFYKLYLNTSIKNYYTLCLLICYESISLVTSFTIFTKTKTIILTWHKSFYLFVLCFNLDVENVILQFRFYFVCLFLIKLFLTGLGKDYALEFAKRGAKVVGKSVYLVCLYTFISNINDLSWVFCFNYILKLLNVLNK